MPIQRVVYTGGANDDTVVTRVPTQRVVAITPGDGTNEFRGEADSRRFRYRGGDDGDNVVLGLPTDPEAVDAEFAGINLGDGENIFNGKADVAQTLQVRGGDDADTIISSGHFGQDVTQTAIFRLGDGDNALMLDGHYDRLFVRGGADRDSIFFDTTSSVESRVGVRLFGGNDFMSVGGSHDADFYFDSANGHDEIRIEADFPPPRLGSFSARLGNGTNMFLNDGTINGDLFVTSFNPDDVFENTGSVNGNVIFRPGLQGGG